jgi:hypothetical protein
MLTATVDPRLSDVAVQISSALSSGTGGAGIGYSPASTIDSAVTRDAASIAASLLGGYHSAVMVNPSKAFQTKAMTPDMPLATKEEIMDKGFWDDVWNVVQTAGPVVVNALSKDYRADPPSLATAIQSVPPNRRNDKDWVDFTTNLLLGLAQGAVQSLSGQKDFSIEANRPQLPAAPMGKDKGWFDDAISFVKKAAPVAIPIAMSVL